MFWPATSLIYILFDVLTCLISDIHFIWCFHLPHLWYTFPIQKSIFSRSYFQIPDQPDQIFLFWSGQSQTLITTRIKVIKRTAVRETCVSRHHGDPIEGLLDPLEYLIIMGSRVWRGPSIGPPLWRETTDSQIADIFFFQFVWILRLWNSFNIFAKILQEKHTWITRKYFELFVKANVRSRLFSFDFRIKSNSLDPWQEG